MKWRKSEWKKGWHKKRLEADRFVLAAPPQQWGVGYKNGLSWKMSSLPTRMLETDCLYAGSFVLQHWRLIVFVTPHLHKLHTKFAIFIVKPNKLLGSVWNNSFLLCTNLFSYEHLYCVNKTDFHLLSDINACKCICHWNCLLCISYWMFMWIRSY